ncbi:unnamed protein product [Chrysoparadoxa australica]
MGAGASVVADGENVPPAVNGQDGFGPIKAEYAADKEKGMNNAAIFEDLSLKHRVPVPRKNANGRHFSDVSATLPIGWAYEQKREESRRASIAGTTARSHTEKVKRGIIFDKGFDFGNVSVKTRAKNMNEQLDKTKEVFSDENKPMVVEALGRFLHLESIEDILDSVLDSMEKRTVAAGAYLMKEGEEGNEMYILKEGVCECTVTKENVVRTIGPGATVGELALLYSAPRSGTVVVKETAVLWVLKREKFREVSAVSNTATLVERCQAIKSVPEFNDLNTWNIAKLAEVQTRVVLKAGQAMYEEGVTTDRCYVLESGSLEGQSKEPTNRTEMSKMIGANIPPPPDTGDAPPTPDGETMIYKQGTFFGIPVLFSAGNARRKAWLKKEDDDEKKTFLGAVPPASVVALEDCTVSYFTVQQFQEVVGNVKAVFKAQLSGRPSLARLPSFKFTPKKEEVKFSVDDFTQVQFLGTGSFGRVTLVKFANLQTQMKSPKCSKQKLFALKALSKQAVIDRGQLAHVRDERLLLQNLDHPFVLAMFAFFQDDTSIYLLMEAVTAGEMWSVVYEGLAGYPEGKLPVEHGRFYSSTVLEALAYMHGKGVAYRDLKPENIMVDEKGYPRLIDLGFAKKIPFTIDAGGRTEVHPKSFTMCGTPEYLAPEFIFNSGHDRSVDWWAFGALAFEFIAGHTPFQGPADSADMTALFTRIACSKRDGIAFPYDFDRKAKGKELRDLVTKLLNSEHTARLGNLAGGPADVRNHEFFSSIDWEKLVAKTIPAPWKPPKAVGKPAEDDGEHKDPPPFKGDPADFADW